MKLTTSKAKMTVYATYSERETGRIEGRDMQDGGALERELRHEAIAFARTHCLTLEREIQIEFWSHDGIVLRTHTVDDRRPEAA